MPEVAYAALAIWPFVCLSLFVFLSPTRAVAISVVFGWLFLPCTVIQLTGLPEISKATVIAIGLSVAAILFSGYSWVKGLRLCFIDFLMITWCACPILTSLSNKLGLYDGLSNVFLSCQYWGVPYLFGRAVFRAPRDLLDLARLVVFSALTLVPLCVFELRMSPQLHRLVYGSHSRGYSATRMRWGGYRPEAFLETGLELALWIGVGCLIAYAIWRLRLHHNLRNSGAIVLALGLTVIACKSVGALGLVAVGVLVFEVTVRFRRRWILLGMACLPFIYILIRSVGLWDGSNLVEISRQTVGADRAASLAYRFENERILADHALRRPVFGWGGYGRSSRVDEDGHSTVPDGLWVQALGEFGLVGCCALFGSLIGPLFQMDVRGFREPLAWLSLAVAIAVGIFAIDCLSNAMENVAFPLMAGGLVSNAAYLRNVVSADPKLRGRSQCSR